MSTYVVRNRLSRLFINERTADVDGVTALKLAEARKFETLEEARDVQGGNPNNRDVFRVSYVLRWHDDKTGEITGYRPFAGGVDTRKKARRFDSAADARACPAPMMFVNNGDDQHLRVVRVLTKVR